MIHTTQKQGEIKSWNESRKYLTREFEVELNFEQAWQQNDSLHYDWMRSQQTFIHKFKCQYATIRGTFHVEMLPDRDRLLKRKLLQGFRRDSRDFLETSMDDNIPLNKFLRHVESKRAIFLTTQMAVNSVPSPIMTVGKSPSTGVGQSGVSSPTPSEERIAELTATVEKLQ